MKLAPALVISAALAAVNAPATAREWGGMYVPLDENDAALLEAAADKLDASGDDGPETWHNARNGTRGSIEIARRFEQQGLACVLYRVRIQVSGMEPFVSNPVACQVGGEWKLIAGTDAGAS